MLHLSLLFWLAFLLPGLAVVRRYDAEAKDSGFLGVLGFAWLWSFALIAPVAVLGFCLRMPLGVLGTVCMALIAWGAQDLVRRGGLADSSHWFRGALGLGFLLLTVLLLLGSRTGSFLGGDAVLHMARIRQMLDHGLVNDDPFVAGGHFYPLYHTNLWHALQAVSAWTFRLDHLGAWHASLPFAQLLVACGAWALAWEVFGRHWVAWVVTVFFLTTLGTIDYLNYPNKLAPFFIMPLMLSATLRTLRGPLTVFSVLTLASGMGVISLFHGLYGIYAALVLGPTLAARALWAWWRGLGSLRLHAASVALCALALPMPLISRAQTVVDRAPPAPRALAVEDGGSDAPDREAESPAGFIRCDNGWVMKHPRHGFGAKGGGFRYGVLALGALVGLLTVCRRRVVWALILTATCLGFLYVPPVCTWLLHRVGQPWIILRLETTIVPLMTVVLGVGSSCFWIASWTQSVKVRGGALIALVALAFPYGDYPPPRTWEAHARWATDWMSPGRERLHHLREIRQFLQETVPEGATLLADEQLGTMAVLLHDCHILAPFRGSLGVPNIGGLRYENAVLLSEDATWPERRTLLERHGIRYVLTDLYPRPWERHCVRRGARAPQLGLRVLELRWE